MPFSKLFKMPKGKFDSTQDKNTTTCSNHPSFVPQNDFVDIVWENGQISMSSRRTRKVPAASKYGQIGTTDYDFRTPETRSNEGDNMVHEPVRHGSSSDFISEVTANQNHVSSTGQRIRSNMGSVHNESISSASRQCQTSFPYLRSKVQDSICNNMKHQQKQDLFPLSTSSASMNFPLFSLPASLRQKETSPSCTPASVVPEKVDLRSTEDKAEEEPVGAKRPELTCQENALKPDLEKPVLASSSVCSGSSIEKPSGGEARELKRKSRDSEDSEWPSEDESMDVRRAARARRGRSAKRSRAAQVHNLSERVRRDRINEKMRALQELVPNCNKTDKASMLDEAIEYLKTLKLQVQMMSMGGGLHMPPMMMQHFMGHLSPMVGMAIPDMIGGSSGSPMIQGGHFPGLHMFGPPANLQLFNPPVLGLPTSTPSFALSGSKDLMLNFNSQAMPNGGTNESNF